MSETTLRVLVIAGGGIKGIIPAEMINNIEQNIIHDTCYNYFDIFVGTSTGALISAMLAYKNVTGNFLVNAMYSYKNANIIMNKTMLDKIFGIAQMSSKYSDEGKKSIINEYTKNDLTHTPLTLNDITPNKYFMSCAYNVTDGKLKFFKSWDTHDKNLLLSDVLNATSAAPTYFPMHTIAMNDREIKFADGGIFANDLTDCIGIELLTDKFKHHTKIEILTLGTGTVPVPIPNINNGSWGGFQWLRNGLINIMFAGCMEAVNYKMVALSNNNGWKYLRINEKLTVASQEMDDVSDTNIKNLRKEAEIWISINYEDLKAFFEV